MNVPTLVYTRGKEDGAMLKNGNFAYLNWLSKQTKAYWFVIGIFAFLLGMNVHAYWQEEKQSIADKSELQVENLVATVEQEVQPPLEAEEELLVESAPNLPEAIYVNPLDLAAYRSPCKGKVLCNFGVNFDERFGDYRYHQGVVYQLSQEEITAALDGTVTNIYQEFAENVLVIDEGTYQLIYRGLTQVEVTLGEQIARGQKIGLASQILTIEAIKYQ